METIVYETLANDSENILVVLCTLIQIDWEFLNKQMFFRSSLIFYIDIFFFTNYFVDSNFKHNLH